MSGEEVKAVKAESVKSHDQAESNVNEKAAPEEKAGTTESNVDEAEAKHDKHKDESSPTNQHGN
jgi:hypothetical protein